MFPNPFFIFCLFFVVSCGAHLSAAYCLRLRARLSLLRPFDFDSCSESSHCPFCHAVPSSFTTTSIGEPPSASAAHLDMDLALPSFFASSSSSFSIYSSSSLSSPSPASSSSGASSSAFAFDSSADYSRSSALLRDWAIDFALKKLSKRSALLAIRRHPNAVERASDVFSCCISSTPSR